MSDGETPVDTSNDLKRKAQELFAQGVITREEYDAIVSSTDHAAKGLGDHAALGLKLLAYGALLLAAVAEAVAQVRPDLQGPLETVAKLGHLIGQTLGF